MEIDPKKRITIDQIKNHNWIKTCELKQKSKGKFYLNILSLIKVNLFTDAEKILLSKSNIDFRYANKDDIIENFSRRNLDTLFEQENLNINTKSVILAPFNSSWQNEKHNNFNSRIFSSSNDTATLQIENNAIKFCGKVKELNRNYELNNNGEIDNGIIIPQKSKVFFLLLKIFSENDINLIINSN